MELDRLSLRPSGNSAPVSTIGPEAEVLESEGADAVSGTDKAKNKVQDMGGKAKEAVGKVTGDKATENEGKDDQTKSNLKGAGEKVKDAFKS
jgi:uncharacterized protein YjbJ (UPF0337 family)